MITLADHETIAEISTGEYTEKHSRFIATLYPCGSEDEAAQIIDEHKRKYWDARHNVYAYILKDNTAKFSDDGEPHSTAGKPVYDCLLHSGLTDVLAIVTRYFGGILLGTGGLVRAYTAATKAAIDSAARVYMRECAVFEISIPYSEQGRVGTLLENVGAVIKDTYYSENVKLTFAVKAPDVDTFEEKLREISGDKLRAKKISDEILPIILKK